MDWLWFFKRLLFAWSLCFISVLIARISAEWKDLIFYCSVGITSGYLADIIFKFFDENKQNTIYKIQ